MKPATTPLPIRPQYEDISEEEIEIIKKIELERC